MGSKFEKQLEALNDMLIEMGSMIEKAITMANAALENRDAELAKKAVAYDREINQKEKDIESLCLRLLLRQQPVARDLRLISAALKMITDMERIGDHAGDISQITILLAGTPHIKKPEHIPRMAAATAKMVTDSIDAFVKKDLQLARDVMEYDNIVDGLFKTLKLELIDLIRSDSANSELAIDLIMIAKYFERIGDHAVNIAEWVEFSITGTHGEVQAIE